MKIDQRRWSDSEGWLPPFSEENPIKTDLVLVFASTAILKNRLQLDLVRSKNPESLIIGCSTSGEIQDTEVTDETMVMTSIQFNKTKLKKAHIPLTPDIDSKSAGISLAKELLGESLKHVFVLSSGLNINGSELVKGLMSQLPEAVSITGGLAGDGIRFEETYILNDGKPEKESIVAIGFYGNHIHIGFGSLGGWDPFGPERLVTKSSGNVLYEVDNKSALDLYKRYLGEHAAGLPATGLLFPLSLREETGQEGKVRTILSVNEEQQSMTFAGDVPEGAFVRLMKANFDRLIDGAIGATRIANQALGKQPPELAILISCVGRKMVLQQRIEEEVEGAREVLGDKTTLAGFYSYGEISPFGPEEPCALHNQTMTVTTFSES